jgi:hypothetical protein
MNRFFKTAVQQMQIAFVWDCVRLGCIIVRGQDKTMNRIQKKQRANAKVEIRLYMTKNFEGFYFCDELGHGHGRAYRRQGAIALRFLGARDDVAEL